MKSQEDFSLTSLLHGHNAPITTLCFSSDSKYIFSSSDDSTIRIWSLHSSTEITKFQGHLGPVNSFAISSNNSTIVSGGSDFSVCWWDIGRGSLIRKIRNHTGPVNSVCYNDDSSVAISGSHDSAVMIWDSRSPAAIPIQTLSDSKDAVTAVASGRNDILVGSVDGKLRTYDVRRSCGTVDSFAAAIVGIELSADRQTVVLSRLDSKAVLFVKATGESIQTYVAHTATKYMVRAHFAAEDAFVVSGSESGEVFVWDAVKATVEHRFSFGEGPVLDVAAQKSPFSLGVGSANGDIGLFAKAGR
jgi:mitogen-activated protein kinase organizer 1